jgi:membrane protein
MKIASKIKRFFVGVIQTIMRSWHGLFERRIPMMSAGLAFYFLLGLIPFLFILAATAGYFLKNNPGIQNQLTTTVVEFFPQGLGDRLLPHIGSTAEGWQGFGAFGLLGIVLVAMGLFDALDDGINAAMGTRKKVGFLTGRVISLAYVVGAILFFSIAAGASYSLKLFAALPVFQEYPALVEMPGRYFSMWVFAVFLIALYMTFPVKPPKFLHAVVIALIVTVVWSVLQRLGTYITAGITRRQAIYGALAGAAVFLTWMYLLAFLILLGARILDFWRTVTERGDSAIGDGPGDII